jgi:tRNA(Ile2) C34 agmatinyltransferase TiaS
MRIYIGFDDTDNKDADRGTGKLARWFERELPSGCHMWGVVRQQLLLHDDIPYTSHNSSACVVVDTPHENMLEMLTGLAVDHLKRHSLPGSDPGVCVASNGNRDLSALTEFGRLCTREVVSQKDALGAASGFHLSGHGGTNDGIIGAAAAVGLTASGWIGRFIEFGGLRDFQEQVSVSELEAAHILVTSLERDALPPAPKDQIHTGGWLRPRLWGNRAVLAVRKKGEGLWASMGGKQKKG